MYVFAEGEDTNLYVLLCYIHFLCPAKTVKLEPSATLKYAFSVLHQVDKSVHSCLSVHTRPFK